MLTKISNELTLDLDIVTGVYYLETDEDERKWFIVSFKDMNNIKVLDILIPEEEAMIIIEMQQKIAEDRDVREVEEIYQPRHRSYSI